MITYDNNDYTEKDILSFFEKNYVYRKTRERECLN